LLGERAWPSLLPKRRYDLLQSELAASVRPERKPPLNMPQIVLCVAIARKEPLPLPASCLKVDHDCQCGQAVHCSR
jgi:hypothetical protein